MLEISPGSTFFCWFWNNITHLLPYQILKIRITKCYCCCHWLLEYLYLPNTDYKIRLLKRSESLLNIIKLSYRKSVLNQTRMEVTLSLMKGRQLMLSTILCRLRTFAVGCRQLVLLLWLKLFNAVVTSPTIYVCVNLLCEE